MVAARALGLRVAGSAAVGWPRLLAIIATSAALLGARASIYVAPPFADPPFTSPPGVDSASCGTYDSPCASIPFAVRQACHPQSNPCLDVVLVSGTSHVFYLDYGAVKLLGDVTVAIRCDAFSWWNMCIVVRTGLGSGPLFELSGSNAVLTLEGIVFLGGTCGWANNVLFDLDDFAAVPILEPSSMPLFRVGGRGAQLTFASVSMFCFTQDGAPLISVSGDSAGAAFDVVFFWLIEMNGVAPLLAHVSGDNAKFEVMRPSLSTQLVLELACTIDGPFGLQVCAPLLNGNPLITIGGNDSVSFLNDVYYEGPPPFLSVSGPRARVDVSHSFFNCTGGSASFLGATAVDAHLSVSYSRLFQSTSGGELTNWAWAPIQNGGVLEISAGASAAIVGSTFSGYDVESPLKLGQFSARQGGALYCSSGVLTVDTSTFERFSASVAGGAIFVEGCSTVVRNSVFRSNAAVSSGSGGAVFAAKGSAVSVHNSVFHANAVSSGGGGAMYSKGCAVSVDNSTFRANTVSLGNGGAVFTEGSSVVVDDVVFDANAAYSGSALFLANSQATVASSVFVNNAAGVPPLSNKAPSPQLVEFGGTVHCSGGANYSSNGRLATLLMRDANFSTSNSGWGYVLATSRGSLTRRVDAIELARVSLTVAPSASALTSNRAVYVYAARVVSVSDSHFVVTCTSPGFSVVHDLVGASGYTEWGAGFGATHPPTLYSMSLSDVVFSGPGLDACAIPAPVVSAVTGGFEALTVTLANVSFSDLRFDLASEAAPVFSSSLGFEFGELQHGAQWFIASDVTFVDVACCGCVGLIQFEGLSERMTLGYPYLVGGARMERMVTRRVYGESLLASAPPFAMVAISLVDSVRVNDGSFVNPPLYFDAGVSRMGSSVASIVSCGSLAYLRNVASGVGIGGPALVVIEVLSVAVFDSTFAHSLNAAGSTLASPSSSFGVGAAAALLPSGAHLFGGAMSLTLVGAVTITGVGVSHFSSAYAGGAIEISAPAAQGAFFRQPSAQYVLGNLTLVGCGAQLGSAIFVECGRGVRCSLEAVGVTVTGASSDTTSPPPISRTGREATLFFRTDSLDLSDFFLSGTRLPYVLSTEEQAALTLTSLSEEGALTNALWRHSASLSRAAPSVLAASNLKRRTLAASAGPQVDAAVTLSFSPLSPAVVTLTDVTIEGLTSTVAAPGISVYGPATFELRDSTLTHLTCSGPSPAALDLSVTSIFLTDVTLSDLLAVKAGAAIVSANIAELTRVTVARSITSASGACFFVGPGCDMTIAGVTCSESSALRAGGGIFMSPGSMMSGTGLLLRHCSSRAGDGGGMLMSLNAHVHISESSFSSCSARLGGAVAVLSGGSFAVSASNFSSNSAANAGGALGADAAAALVLHDCVFSGNAAGIGVGGAISARATPLELSGCTFERNAAMLGAAVMVEAPPQAPLSSVEGTSENCPWGAPASLVALLVRDTSVANNTGEAGMTGSAIVVSDGSTGSHAVPVGPSSLAPSSTLVCIAGSTFEGNGGSSGGSVHVDVAAVALSIADSVFSGNNAAVLGGALAVSVHDTYVQESGGAEEGEKGGAEAPPSPHHRRSSSSSEGSPSEGSTGGGGASGNVSALPSSSVVLLRNLFSDNTAAASNGGAVHLSGALSLTIGGSSLFGPGNVAASVLGSDLSVSAEVAVSFSAHSSPDSSHGTSSTPALTAAAENVSAPAGLLNVSTAALNARAVALGVPILSPELNTGAQPPVSVVNAAGNGVQLSGMLTTSNLYREGTCPRGAALVAGLCAVCPIGSFSLSPSAPCSVCPTGVLCAGGAAVYPLQGYSITALVSYVLPPIDGFNATMVYAIPPTVSTLHVLQCSSSTACLGPVLAPCNSILNRAAAVVYKGFTCVDISAYVENPYDNLNPNVPPDVALEEAAAVQPPSLADALALIPIGCGPSRRPDSAECVPCAEGFGSAGSDCLPCPSAGLLALWECFLAALLIAFTLIVVKTRFTMNESAADHLARFVIFIIYMQGLSLLATTVAFDWGGSTMTNLLSSVTHASFVSGLLTSPDCIMQRWGVPAPVASTIFWAVVLPAVLVCSCLVGSVYLCCFLEYKRYAAPWFRGFEHLDSHLDDEPELQHATAGASGHTRSTSPSSNDVLRETRVSWAPGVTQGGVNSAGSNGAATDNERHALIHVSDYLVSLCLSLVIVFIQPVATRMLAVFECIDVGDGVRRLRMDLDILCYSGVHLNVMVPISVIVLVVVLIAAPWYAFSELSAARFEMRSIDRAIAVARNPAVLSAMRLYPGTAAARRMLELPATLDELLPMQASVKARYAVRFAALLQPMLWWWEAFNLVRRVGLVLILSCTVSSGSTLQLILGLGYCSCAFLLHHRVVPYSAPGLDRFEYLTLLALSMTFFLSIFVTDGTAVISNTAAVVVVVVNSFVLVVFVVGMLTPYWWSVLAATLLSAPHPDLDTGLSSSRTFFRVTPLPLPPLPPPPALHSAEDVALAQKLAALETRKALQRTSLESVQRALAELSPATPIDLPDYTATPQLSLPAPQLSLASSAPDPIIAPAPERKVAGPVVDDVDDPPPPPRDAPVHRTGGSWTVALGHRDSDVGRLSEGGDAHPALEGGVLALEAAPLPSIAADKEGPRRSSVATAAAGVVDVAVGDHSTAALAATLLSQPLAASLPSAALPLSPLAVSDDSFGATASNSAPAAASIWYPPPQPTLQPPPVLSETRHSPETVSVTVEDGGASSSLAATASFFLAETASALTSRAQEQGADKAAPWHSSLILSQTNLEAQATRIARNLAAASADAAGGSAIPGNAITAASPSSDRDAAKEHLRQMVLATRPGHFVGQYASLPEIVARDGDSPLPPATIKGKSYESPPAFTTDFAAFASALRSEMDAAVASAGSSTVAPTRRRRGSSVAAELPVSLPGTVPPFATTLPQAPSTADPRQGRPGLLSPPNAAASQSSISPRTAGSPRRRDLVDAGADAANSPQGGTRLAPGHATAGARIVASAAGVGLGSEPGSSRSGSRNHAGSDLRARISAAVSMTPFR